MINMSHAPSPGSEKLSRSQASVAAQKAEVGAPATNCSALDLDSRSRTRNTAKLALSTLAAMVRHSTSSRSPAPGEQHATDVTSLSFQGPGWSALTQFLCTGEQVELQQSAGFGSGSSMRGDFETPKHGPFLAQRDPCMRPSLPDWLMTQAPPCQAQPGSARSAGVRQGRGCASPHRRPC